MPANPPTKQAARLPKARVGCVRFSQFGSMHLTSPLSVVAHESDLVHHCAVIPTRTVTEARALIRVAGFFAMGEAEQREALQDIIYRAIPYAGKRLGYADSSSAAKTARAVLTLIASGGARK